MTVPRVLSIAGSDPSGGAGIQADLKTFSALGTYGMAVIAALTAQNTTGVSAFQAVDPDLVAAQIDLVFADIEVDAVKIGMLGSAEVAHVVAEAVQRHRPPAVVLDPVMVATSGDRLLTGEAVDTIRGELLPLVDLVTPKAGEAAVLLGVEPATTEEELSAQARSLAAATGTLVLAKGGHLAGDRSVDVLAGDGPLRRFDAPRIDTANTHGTGCTLSSAIAAIRTQSASWTEAVTAAKSYLTNALRAADRLEVGHGHGPVHHFWGLWPAG